VINETAFQKKISSVHLPGSAVREQVELHAASCSAVYQHPDTRSARCGASSNRSKVFGGSQTMDRFLLPSTIPGAVQQGIAAIPAKDRRLVVGDYVKHLVDTQAVIIKCAAQVP
jgi:hypothetical protein